MPVNVSIPVDVLYEPVTPEGKEPVVNDKTSPEEKLVEILTLAPSIVTDPVSVSALSTTAAGALFAIFNAEELPLSVICENERIDKTKKRTIVKMDFINTDLVFSLITNAPNGQYFSLL